MISGNSGEDSHRGTERLQSSRDPLMGNGYKDVLIVYHSNHKTDPLPLRCQLRLVRPLDFLLVLSPLPE